MCNYTALCILFAVYVVAIMTVMHTINHLPEALIKVLLGAWCAVLGAFTSVLPALMFFSSNPG